MSFRKIEVVLTIPIKIYVNEEHRVGGYEHPSDTVVQAAYDASRTPVHLPVCQTNSCTNPGEPDHPCPYKQDVDNDDETMCNCCAECQSNCAMEV